MDLQHFNAVVDDQLNEIRDILVSKGAEYVPGEAKSRFHNFDVGAALNGETNTEALWGYLTKHLVSLADMAKGDSTQHSMEKWAEKISDSITYLVLLRAMVTHNNSEDFLVILQKKLTEPGVISQEAAQAALGIVSGEDTKPKTQKADNIVINTDEKRLQNNPYGFIENSITPQRY